MTGGNATLSKRSSALIALLVLTLVACTALSLRALSQNSLAEALQQQSAFLKQMNSLAKFRSITTRQTSLQTCHKALTGYLWQ